jgi:hypothetical protein
MSEAAERFAETVEDFAARARAFCQWIETDAGGADDGAVALVLLVDLYRAGLALEAAPAPAPAPVPEADLADDLAAIWQTLRGGLAALDAGDADAAWRSWGAGFWTDWGPRTLAALATLHAAVGPAAAGPTDDAVR